MNASTESHGRIPITKKINGSLLRSPASRFADRVFFCTDTHRHWVSSGEWILENGFKWPDDVTDVSPSEIECLKPGRAVSSYRTVEQRLSLRPTSVIAARELMLSGLFGSGLEIGPGANPLPVPMACQVQYADMFSYDDLKKHAYDGQNELDIIAPDFIASLENLDTIEESSQYFIVASHVIEHTTDPIGAIIRAGRKLKPGGSIGLVVPDKRKTFDVNRPTTSLDHMVDDYRNPSRERDKAHFREFYSIAFPEPAEKFEAVWHTKWMEGFPIHYHVWNFETFGTMADWILAEEDSFQSVWRYEPFDLNDAIEFYYVFTKKST